MFSFLLTILLCGSPVMEIHTDSITYLEKVMERDFSICPEHRYQVAVEQGDDFLGSASGNQEWVMEQTEWLCSREEDKQEDLCAWFLACLE